MRIFVTSGSGYIRSVMTEMLCDGGHEVTVFDNLERCHREAVDPRAKLVVGDLRRRVVGEELRRRELSAAERARFAGDFALWAYESAGEGEAELVSEARALWLGEGDWRGRREERRADPCSWHGRRPGKPGRGSGGKGLEGGVGEV